jgi:diaminopimelate decarboxylase
VVPIIQAIDVVEEIIKIFRQANFYLKIVDIGLGYGVPYLAKNSALDMSALREQLWLRWQSEMQFFFQNRYQTLAHHQWTSALICRNYRFC